MPNRIALMMKFYVLPTAANYLGDRKRRQAIVAAAPLTHTINVYLNMHMRFSLDSCARCDLVWHCVGNGQPDDLSCLAWFVLAHFVSLSLSLRCDDDSK